MAAGRAAALVEHEVHVVVLAGDGVGVVVELHAVYHLGGGDGLTGPVAVELLVRTVPSVEIHLRPVVGSHRRVLEENGNLIGLKVSVLDRIVAGDDTAHGAVDQQTHLQGRVGADVHARAIGHLGAVAGGGLAAVEGIDELSAIGLAHGVQRDTERALVLTAGLAGPCSLGRLAQSQAVVGTAGHEDEGSRHVIGGGAHHGQHRAAGAHGALHIVVLRRAVGHVGRGAHVGDASQLADINHLLDALLVVLPVLEEDAGSAGHGQQISIGGLDILGNGVLRSAGAAILRVVVLDKGHRIALVVGLHVQTLARTGQVAPTGVVDGVTDGVAEGEIECGALDHATHLGAFDPVPDSGNIAVPILAYRVLCTHMGVV